MSMTKLRLKYVLILLAAGLLCLGTSHAMAQTESPEPEVTDPLPPDEGDVDDGDAPNAANPPAYIVSFIEAEILTSEQVETMRTGGLGWGEIRIATRLAEQMAANSEGTLSFDDALQQVLDARAEDTGFGEIAGENDLKVGDLVGNEKAGKASEAGVTARNRNKEHVHAATAEQKKPGFLARLGKFLGFGRSADKPAKPDGVENVQGSAIALKNDTPGKPAGVTELHASAKTLKGDRPERPVRVEHPDRPERPEKPEKFDRPERPSKPERPERGPNR